jgi:hypothetical protein
VYAFHGTGVGAGVGDGVAVGLGLAVAAGVTAGEGVARGVAAGDDEDALGCTTANADALGGGVSEPHAATRRASMSATGSRWRFMVGRRATTPTVTEI